MKFKVGDRVTVKGINEIRSSIDTRVITSEMLRLCDKEVTIEFVGDNYYYIKEDPNCFYWDDGMLKDIRPRDKLYIGKCGEFYIIIKNGILQNDFYESIREIDEIYGKKYTLVVCN